MLHRSSGLLANVLPKGLGPRREWQHVMTYDIQSETADPFRMALVHYRFNFTWKRQYGPSNQNEIRWEYTEHEGCDRKIRIVEDGAQIKIWISGGINGMLTALLQNGRYMVDEILWSLSSDLGDHTGEPRNLKHVRFPPHIEQYILDAASRGENASHVLARKSIPSLQIV